MNQTYQFRILDDNGSSHDRIIVELETLSVRLPKTIREGSFVITRLIACQIRWENWHWTSWVNGKVDRVRTECVLVEPERGVWKLTKSYLASLNK